MVPNDEGKLRLAVTAGKTCPVTVYLETAGPMVRITGDAGIPHEITGDYLDNFRWIPRKLSGSKYENGARRLTKENREKGAQLLSQARGVNVAAKANGGNTALRPVPKAGERE
jgi:hypothetical protein